MGYNENIGWNYIVNIRPTISGIRYAKGRIMGVDAGANQYVNGLILLPDDWNSEYYTLINTNDGIGYSGGYIDFISNEITLDDWVNIFEAHCAVFLPVGGCRNGSGAWGCNYYCGYWSSFHYMYTSDISKVANGIYFYHKSDGLLDGPYSRYCGNAVRLVMDVN